MKDKLGDLNTHLFAQLERLSEESLKGDELEEEIRRAKAVTDISREIVSNAKLVLDAKIAIKEWSLDSKELPYLRERNNAT